MKRKFGTLVGTFALVAALGLTWLAMSSDLIGTRQHTVDSIAAVPSPDVRPPYVVDRKFEQQYGNGERVMIPAVDRSFSVQLEQGETPKVAVDLTNPEVSKAYYAANTARIERLIADPAWIGREIEVTVIFDRPVPWDEFVALRGDVNLDPILYEIAALGRDGTKWSQAQIAKQMGARLSDDAIIASVSREAAHAGTTVQGVIMVEANIIVGPDTLGRLAADKRVFAVDTVEAEAREMLAINNLDLAELSSSSLERIRVPTPFMDREWTPASD